MNNHKNKIKQNKINNNKLFQKNHKIKMINNNKI